MSHVTHSQVECFDLPEYAEPGAVYRLLPKKPDPVYYQGRTDRNIGWITRAEQELLRSKVIGIAGCGGMGGALASVFVRLGIGEVRIADNEVFDVSNINRQAAATRRTVGISKALATCRMIREITDDTTLVVYPAGICEASVSSFVAGCDVICDEIEFWAVAARILLHQHGRAANVPLFNCNTVGFSTRLFLFTAESQTMEARLGLNYPEALELEGRLRAQTATAEERLRVMEAVIEGLVPELPEYCGGDPNYRTVPTVKARLLSEGRASIIATNPPMATGFLADHVLLYLLRGSGISRDVIRPPATPGYLIFDAATFSAQVRPG